MIDIIDARESVPWSEIRLVASARSAGKVLRVRGEDVTVAGARSRGLRRRRRRAVRRARRGQRRVGADRRRARRGGRRQLRRVPHGPRRAAGGARGQRRPGRPNRPKGIIANPNCTTLSMMAAMGALHREFGLEALVVASYQAASGAGQAGIDQLQAELAAVAGKGRRRARRRRRGGARRRRARRRRLAVPGAARAQRRAVGRVAEGRRLVVGGAEGPQRVAQDPRHPGPQGLGHLRAGPGRHHALAGRARHVRAARSSVEAAHKVLGRAADDRAARRPGRGRVAHAGGRRSAATRPGSAGSGRRWTSPTPSSCSSAATTCARVPR